MTKHRVLITDYAWPDVEIEQTILAESDAELIVASAGDEDTLTDAADGVDAIMTNWAKVTGRVIDAAPDLKIVARLGIGLDNIDVARCTERGIVVTNVPDYCLIEVAEHALACILAFARKIAFYHHQTKSGKYELQAGPPQLTMMKPHANLINTARGGLIDHEALAEAIQRGEIAGAALDVHDPEPADLSLPLYNSDRVIATPHAAFVSIESLENLRTRTARQVVACLTGEVPENVRNPEVLKR